MKRHHRSSSAKSKPSIQPEAIFTIQNLSHEGRGVALYDEQSDTSLIKQGKKVFIRFALPDEVVKAKITHVHKRFEEADMVELISNPSPDRVTPICLHFGTCGGCAMQHIHVDRQIALKQQVLVSHFQHFAGIQPDHWLEPIRSTRVDYRRRARFGVRWSENAQKLILGFRAIKSNVLTPISECVILDQRIAKHLLDLTTVLGNLANKRNITDVEFSAGDLDVAILIRHVTEFKNQDIEKIENFSNKVGWKLYLQSDRYQRLKQGGLENATMHLNYKLPEYDLDLIFSPLDFTQVNAEVNQQMVHLACQLLDLKKGERVLDLFCGLGNFSFALARHVGTTGQVIAVEGIDEMVKRGEENARRNHFTNVKFVVQDLAVDFSDQDWAKQGFDAILIDPPRAGAEFVMRYIAHFAAKRIVYVSCDPATLARDTGILIQKGYRLVAAGVMDMFTHTEHVESMTLFEKVAPMTDDDERKH